ncbi:MAG: outer membrane lipoprotein-sorting protein [Myxococcales bacterium]|nr:outer membrane lipoprotein-sorting protein [Myxococcales bacterium]
MSRLSLTVFLASALAGAPAAHATSFEELVRRADMATRSKTSAAVLEMHVKTASYQRRMRLVFWQDDRGGRERVLIRILGPALWRGHGTLKIGSQLKLYNPRQNHVTVVGSSMLGDSWMGSHFSNDDLVKETRLARHYTAKLLKKWDGKSDIGAATYYRFRLVPKPTAPVAWGKIVYTVLEKGTTVLPIKAAYFRKYRDRKPKRTMSFTDIKTMSGRKVPAVMTVRVMSKPGEFTRLTYRKLKLDINIPASKFTEQALRR